MLEVKLLPNCLLSCLINTCQNFKNPYHGKSKGKQKKSTIFRQIYAGYNRIQFSIYQNVLVKRVNKHDQSIT